MFSESHGLIFSSFVYLFNQIQNRDDMEFTLTASYLEIYNEKVKAEGGEMNMLFEILIITFRE